jgi:hypothetical protein
VFFDELFFFVARQRAGIFAFDQLLLALALPLSFPGLVAALLFAALDFEVVGFEVQPGVFGDPAIQPGVLFLEKEVGLLVS